MSSSKDIAAAATAALCLALIAWGWWRGDAADWQAALLFGLALAVFYYLLLGKRWILSFWLVILSLLPVQFLATVIIFFAILPLPQAFDPQKPAMITGTVIVAGWVATQLAAEFQRRVERDRDEEEVLRALRQEIYVYFEALDSRDWTRDLKETTENIEKGGDGQDSAYFPFVTSESPAVIFEALRPSISLLRPATLSAIVRFYAELDKLRSRIADMQRPSFEKLDVERRKSFQVALTSIRRNTIYFGLVALNAIDTDILGEVRQSIPRSGNNRDIRLPEVEPS
ncbi:MAG: hypothetical protein OXC60_01440 [Litoreibacter sp.]|nr:hypothetical protein [Litoreibacter sp.]